MWWSRPQRQPLPQRQWTKPLDYPDGVAVKTDAGVFYIKGNKKYKLFSDRATDSWAFDLLPGSLESVKNFKSGPPLGFRNGTLIENMADSKTYLISENKRRHIQNPDVFDKFGFDWEKVYLVSQAETDLHVEGEVLN